MKIFPSFSSSSFSSVFEISFLNGSTKENYLPHRLSMCPSSMSLSLFVPPSLLFSCHITSLSLCMCAPFSSMSQSAPST
jgi:hypothetical protein